MVKTRCMVSVYCLAVTHREYLCHNALCYHLSKSITECVILYRELDHPGHLGHILSWPSESYPLTEGIGSDHVNKFQWSLSVATFTQ